MIQKIYDITVKLIDVNKKDANFLFLLKVFTLVNQKKNKLIQSTNVYLRFQRTPETMVKVFVQFVKVPEKNRLTK
jgi:hypothetical protein